VHGKYYGYTYVYSCTRTVRVGHISGSTERSLRLVGHTYCISLQNKNTRHVHNIVGIPYVA